MATKLFDLSDPAKPRPILGPLDGELMRTLETGAFSADGRFLAALAQDKSLRVWDTHKDTVTSPAVLTLGQVTGLAISRDARIVATLERGPAQRSVRRGNVRLWDVASGRPVSPARPVPGMFWDWQFDPDSRYLVISTAQGGHTFGTQIWKLPAPGTGLTEKSEPETAP